MPNIKLMFYLRMFLFSSKILFVHVYLLLGMKLRFLSYKISPQGALGLLSPSVNNYQPLKLKQYENPKSNLSVHSFIYQFHISH